MTATVPAASSRGGHCVGPRGSHRFPGRGLGNQRNYHYYCNNDCLQCSFLCLTLLLSSHLLPPALLTAPTAKFNKTPFPLLLSCLWRWTPNTYPTLS